MSVTPSKTVLLTGISGFIGLHCAKKLLSQGYHVKGSVRSASKAEQVKNTLQSAGVDSHNLTFVELDLNSDDGWTAAAAGCDFIMHVASPFTIANPKHESEMIEPAVEGTLRALRAAQQARVKRVVLTSSVLSMMGSMKRGTFSTRDWTNVDDKNVSTYTKSKTLAEKAAWKFVEELGHDESFELVVVNPGGVFGPPLGNDVSGQTMTMVSQMLDGKMPMVPNAAFPMVDVRELADIHVKALENRSVSNQRLIAASQEPRGFVAVANILKKAGYSGPSTRIAPNFLLKFAALFDREAKGMIGLLDMNLSADNRLTRHALEWTPMAFEQSVLDTAAKITELQAN